MCGSAVYSDHCLQSSYGFLAEGYKAVVCIAPRTNESRAGNELSDYAQIGEGRIEATAEGLSNFIVRNLHRHARACFLGPEAQTVSQNLVALFFRDTGCFVCRTYEPNPLIISRALLSREIEIDYFTIDVRFISELLGDIFLFRNWTIHQTNFQDGMTKPRKSCELRVIQYAWIFPEGGSC